MLDIKKDKYIIVEIIPTSSNSKVGEIIEISGLKIEGLKLKERFNYRLNQDLILNPDLRNIVNYANNEFTIVDSSEKIMIAFKKFIGKLPLLIIDNSYTRDYLRVIKNKKESVFKYLDLEFSEDIFDILIKKYKLEPSNFLVDLIYESLIFHSEE